MWRVAAHGRQQRFPSTVGNERRLEHNAKVDGFVGLDFVELVLQAGEHEPCAVPGANFVVIRLIDVFQPQYRNLVAN